MSRSPNLSGSQFQNNSAGGLQLDLIHPGETDAYQDRGAFTMYKLNKQYGHQDNSLSSSSGSVIFGYMKCVGGMFKALAACLPGLCCKNYTIEVPQGFIGMLTENGRFVRKLRPGFHLVNALIEKVEVFDIRDSSFHLPHQQVLSKDGVSFGIDAVINYKIIVPELVLYTMSNSVKVVENVAEAALKCVIGQKTFSDMMKDRKGLNSAVESYIEQKLQGTGLQINLVETQSIELSHHLYNVMAMVVEAENRARALVIEAQGDLEGARLLAQAADNMAGNQFAVTLQGWELLENLSHTGLNAIIVPHDILSSFREKTGDSGVQNTKQAVITPQTLQVTNPDKTLRGSEETAGLLSVYSTPNDVPVVQSSSNLKKGANPFEDEEDL